MMKTSLLSMKYASENTRSAAVLINSLKTASPKVVETAVLYVKFLGNEDNLRYLKMTFFSPKLRIKEDADSEYYIEVGDWDEDGNFSQERVKKSLTKLMIPSLKGDVISEDHEILASVLRKLRKVIMDIAIDYFAVPMNDKPGFKRMVRLDIQKLEDTRVIIENNGTREVVQDDTTQEPTQPAHAASKKASHTSKLIARRRS